MYNATHLQLFWNFTLSEILCWSNRTNCSLISFYILDKRLKHFQRKRLVKPLEAMQWTGDQRLWRCCLSGESADDDDKTQSDNRGDVIWWHDSTDRRWREAVKVTTFDIFLEPLWKATLCFCFLRRLLLSKNTNMSTKRKWERSQTLKFVLFSFKQLCFDDHYYLSARKWIFCVCFIRWVASKQHVLFLHELIFTEYIIWFIHKLVC